MQNSKRSPKINLLIGLGFFAALAIGLYWVLWFLAPQTIQVFHSGSPEYPTYVAFEQAFLLADSWLAIVALCGAIGLIKRRRWGLLCMLLAGSSAIFLGLMDLLYDLQHGVFVPLTGEAAIELVIVVLLLGLGGSVIILSWREISHADSLQ
jgi:uncharacterized membrane protein (DUF2068 family)